MELCCLLYTSDAAEQCGMSKYSALELEIERVKDLGKSVVGCVVLE